MAKRGDEKKPVATGQEQTPQAGQQTPPLESDQPAQPPAADQQAQTAAADATTIGALHEMIMVVGDQVSVLAEQMLTLMKQMDELETRLAAGETVPAVWSSTTEQPAIPQIEFDPAWLDGLVFKGSKEVKPDVGDNGRSVKRYQPFTRPATHDDVMSWKVDGDEVSIVLSDGTKHLVER